MRTIPAAGFPAVHFVLLLVRPLAAQGQVHQHAETEPVHPMPAGALGISALRGGSGTSWVPEAAPMYAAHFSAGSWRFMLHGVSFLMYDRQAGPRGDAQASNVNWAMLMATRPAGGGFLQLRTMMSAEPFTVGSRGYPLLLQSGETYQGEPLHDRQHPHDLFMELAVLYERALARNLGLVLYLAPVGEPVIGPVAFPHRPSAANDPLAPLTHHWQDATHTTFGVVTAGLFTRSVKLEGSWFNGREPDEDRYDFDYAGRRLDSWAVRVTANPSRSWSLSASFGLLQSPEALHPERSERRVSASVLYAGRLGSGPDGVWSWALIYGAKKEEGEENWAGSITAEANLDLDRKNSVFGRFDFVRKTGGDLVLPGLPAELGVDVRAGTLGYRRGLLRLGRATLGAGIRGSLAFLPTAAADAYGTRYPRGLAIYLQLRAGASHAMAAMEHQM